MGFNPRIVAHIPQDFLGCVNHPDALHSTEVHGGAVIDVLGSQNGAVDDIIDVGPVPDLLPGTPDNKRVLLHEGACDHGDDSMILDAAGSVHGEVTAGSRL